MEQKRPTARQVLEAELRELLAGSCLKTVPSLTVDDPELDSQDTGEMVLRAAERACPEFGWDYSDLTPDRPFAYARRRVGYFFLPLFPRDIPDGREARLFVEDCYQSLKRLFDQGIDHLVFDLRGHLGGFLRIFMAIAGFFVDPSKRLIYPTSHGSREMRFEGGEFMMLDPPKTVKNSLPHAGTFAKLSTPVRVLVDGITSSCGELIALALRDSLPDCKIVGQTSAGALTMFAQVRVGGYVVSVPHAVLLDHATRKPLLGLTPDAAELEPELCFILPCYPFTSST